MNRASKIVAIILIVVWMCPFFSGCATTQQGQEQTKGTAVGAGLGAAVGAGLGYLIGGRDGALIGAAVGAVAGGTAGYTYASRIYDDIEKLSNKTDAIEQASAQNQRYIDEQKQELANLAERNKELDKQTAALASEYRNQKITAEALTDEKAKVDKELAEARQSYDTNQKELAYLKGTALPAAKKYGSQEQVRKLESQIATVQKQNVEMEKVIEERAYYSQRLVAG